MAIVSVNELEIGQTIQFNSISQYDQVTWKALIVGFVTYDIARLIKDILPYYNQVKKTNPTMTDITRLNYMTLRYYENNVLNNLGVFAKEWLELSSVQILNVNKHFDIRIYEQDVANANTILTLLRSHGYIVETI